MNPVPVDVWTVPVQNQFSTGAPACRIAVGTNKYTNLRRLRASSLAHSSKWRLSPAPCNAQAGLNALSALDGFQINSTLRATSATQ
jgi:hypothetical protein